MKVAEELRPTRSPHEHTALSTMSGAPIDRLDARAADDAAADGADFDAAALDSWADKIKELYTADAEQPYALALQGAELQ